MTPPPHRPRQEASRKPISLLSAGLCALLYLCPAVRSDPSSRHGAASSLKAWASQALEAS
jgi:hypothetical protein